MLVTLPYHTPNIVIVLDLKGAPLFRFHVQVTSLKYCHQNTSESLFYNV